MIHLSIAIQFSESEVKKFGIRYENGYDLTTDQRYNAWLAVYHPLEAAKSKMGMELSGELSPFPLLICVLA